MSGNQPLYYEQMLVLLNAFRPENRLDSSRVPSVMQTVLLRNAQADDGTDRKLDWFSIALCRVLAHNAMPGQHDGMPVDPFFVESLDTRFAGDYPKIHRPHLVNFNLHTVLGMWVEPEVSTQEEMLFLGLLTRTALCCYMLEDICHDSGRDFDEELQSFLMLAVEQLYYLRDQGQDFGGEMELPWHPTLN
jgi:hypothetical protein